MALYVHHDVANPPFSFTWGSVMGSSYSLNSNLITITNEDGTLTRATGTFLVILNVIQPGGVITAVQRTSTDGTTLYESITDAAVDPHAFVLAAAQTKLALVLAGQDVLIGNSGHDELDGYGGADVMAGGDGLDDYYVDNSSDVVVELPNHGNDIVLTSLPSYTLPANVENLSFDGVGLHTGIGNALNNSLSGSSGNTTLYGLDGNDAFFDFGGVFAFYGGPGDDTYSIDDGDIAIELPNEGIDLVNTFLSYYVLGANIEILELKGGGASAVAFGNDLDNKIVTTGSGYTVYGLGGDDTLSSGGGSNDILVGGDGNDTLITYIDSDTLTGGNGDDTFLIHFGTPLITDFAAGPIAQDKIDLVAYKPGAGDSGQFFFTRLADVLAHATQNGPYLVIDLGAGNSLTLKNVFKPGLADDDFVGFVHAVSGGPGADTLVSSANDELLDGGAGDDTVVFSQGLNAYRLVDFGSRIVVWGPDGNDTLVGIEHLRFADGTITPDDGNALFDTVYYMRQNLDVFHAGVDALAHYNAFGWHEGRDPNAYFDTSGYLAVDKDVAASGVNPLEHYHQSGWIDRRDPSLAFDTTLYLAQNPDVAAAGIDPLQHYLQIGMAEGRKTNASIGDVTGGFDAQYYLLRNPDVAAAGVDPLQHFKAFGWHEGRNPNGWFDTAGYLAHYSDVAASGANPLEHYEQFGWKEGRDPSASFDTLGYLLFNPDVAAGGVNPLDHFLTFGIYEGRHAVNDGMWH